MILQAGRQGGRFQALLFALASVPSSLYSAAAAATTQSVSFSDCVYLGNSSADRTDPSMLSIPSPAGADSARAVARGGTGDMATSDGGRTWHAASTPVRQAGHAWGLATRSADGQTIVSGDTGVETGYLKNVSAGPWASTSRWTWTAPSAGGDMAGAGDHTPARQNSIGHLPQPTGLLFWEGGGTSPLDDSGLNFIATPQVWYSDVPIMPKAGFKCCNGSIAAFVTHDAGDTWTYVSDVATKASVEAAGWTTEEGPTENDVVLMGDGKTIMVIFRIDGGDGAPKPSPHVPYLFAKSTDQGATWKYEQAPPSMLAARPRAVRLGNGAVAVAGGRPALNLWVSPSGGMASDGDWETYDIPTLHNEMIGDDSLKFCPAFCNATLDLGWEQSSCYTQVGALDVDTGLVCYQRQGAPSGGQGRAPPECAGPGSQMFCMRFSVQREGGRDQQQHE